jgi:hypothetical protein
MAIKKAPVFTGAFYFHHFNAARCYCGIEDVAVHAAFWEVS